MAEATDPNPEPSDPSAAITPPEGERSETIVGADSGGGDPVVGSMPMLDRIKNYQVIHSIASGGMGTVFKAEQINPRRMVALKVIRPGLAGPATLRRFEFEAQALARLQHPGIAQIFEAGTFDSGQGPQPYFAMEFVEGPALNEHVQNAGLSLREKLALIASICDAVEHAHQKGIIHRDLKPGNILIAPDGQPKILDFGLARAADVHAPNAVSMHTEAGQLLGTVLYMSPEQAQGQVELVDTRSDIYSLGVIGYEMIAGRGPYSSAGKATTALLLAIVAGGIPALSTIDRRFRGDVETIFAKALEREPARRYQSAADFAEDIRRSLRDEPITARPPSAWYQARKFAKRNKAVVAGLAGIAVALVLGVVATFWQAREARLERDRADELRRHADIARAEAEVARATAEERGVQLRRLLYVEQMNSAVEAWKDREFKRLEAILLSQLPEPGAEDLRRFDWFYLWGESHRSPIEHLRTIDTADLPGYIRGGFSPDGRLIAAANSAAIRPKVPGIVNLYDAETGEKTKSLAGHTGGIPGIAFSPDGSRLLTASQDSTARIWDLATGQTIHILEGHKNWAATGAFSPDGKLVATGGGILTMDRPTELMLWDAETGKLVRQIDVKGYKGSVLNMAFSPDGSKLATSIQTIPQLNGTMGIVKLWNVANGEELASYGGKNPEGDALAMAISPDWKTLAEGGQGKTLMLWSLETGKKTLNVPGMADWISALEFSPNGAMLAMGLGNMWTGKGKGEILFWDPALWRQQFAPQAMPNGIWSVRFSPDGGRLAIGSMQSGLDLYNWVKSPDPLGLDTKGIAVASIALSPNPPALGYAWREEAVLDRWSLGVWDPAEKKLLARVDDVSPKPVEMAFSPDGETLAVLTEDQKDFDGVGRMLLWRWKKGGSPLVAYSGRGAQISLSFAPDGATLATGGAFDHIVRIWDVAAGEQKAAFEGHKNPVGAVAFSPDGKRLVSGAFSYRFGIGLFNRDSVEQGELRMWDVASGKTIFEKPAHREGVESIAFGPDGKLVATGGRDSTVRLWNAETGAEIAALQSRAMRWTRAIRFSPDGQTLISGGSRALPSQQGGELAFWDVPTRRLRANFLTPDAGINGLAISPTGRFIAANMFNGRIETWSAPSAEEVEAQVAAAKSK